MNNQSKPWKVVENTYAHNGTILFIRHGIDVEIGLAMAIVTLVRTPATTRRCWQLWQTRITMLVYIVACYSSRRLVNIMTTEKERHRKEKLRLHRTSKVKLGWPQKAEGKCGGYCWMNGTIAWMLHTCQVSRAPACWRPLVIPCEVPSRFESSVISYIDHTAFWRCVKTL